MRIDVLSKEYPPEVYGGAGVHVAELVRALRVMPDVDARVRCFGAPRTEPGTTAYAEPASLAGANAAIRTLGVDLAMVDDCAGADLVHSHTWYANMAGHLASLMHGIPHVVSAHSLEPMRPWKAEQLGGGYAPVELGRAHGVRGRRRHRRGERRDARRRAAQLSGGRPRARARRAQRHRHHPVVARRRTPTACASSASTPTGRASSSSAASPGRRACRYFLRAAAALPPEVQLVLCAGAPDTPEIEAEVRGLVDDLAATRSGVVWIAEMLPRPDVVALLTAATVFACPSIYEPLGIVNLEAMACETAVVATATGGIPEVVVDGETGWLVPIEQATDGTGTPLDPERYVADLAAALTDAVSDPERARAYGVAGRRRAEESFSWDAIAARTLELYRSLA